MHHEINRLPEKYRAPIVLCYMEGLTHDEAAACLNWPVGTVRSRLSRGRDTLRHRLTRRGLAAPAAVGPLGAWLAGTECPAARAARTLSPTAAQFVAKLACQATAAPASAATPVCATSLALAQGVLKMMTIKKVTVMAGVLLTLLTLTAGGGFAFVRTLRTRAEQTNPNRVEEQKAPKSKGDDVDPLIQQMLDIAQRRYDMVLQLYSGGEVGYNALMDAGDQVDKVMLLVADNKHARIAARERSLKRLEGMETRAENAFKAGQVRSSDVLAIKLRRMQAEFDLKSASKEETDFAALLDRLKALENKVQALEKRFPPRSGR